MSLKQLVNNKDIWDSFVEYVEEETQKAYSRLGVVEEVGEFQRIQGEVRALRRLLYLREKVNGSR